MYACFECEKQLNSLDQMLTHLKIFHPLLQKYKCTVLGCHRTFSLITSFRKHFIYKHKERKCGDTTCLAINKTNITDKFIDSSMHSDDLLPPTQKTQNTSEDTLILEKDMVSLLSHLYSNPSLPRNIVDTVFSGVDSLMSSIFHWTLQTLPTEFSTKDQIKNLFDDISVRFARFHSEKLRFTFLETNGYLIKPEPFYIGEYSSVKNAENSGEVIVDIKRVEGQIVPLRKVLKAFLELPNVFFTLMTYMREEMKPQNHYISSIFQGNLWHHLRQTFSNDSIVLPFYLHYDDFEVNNPLGSKAGLYKIGAVYISLAGLPPEYSTLLENILLAQLIFSGDRSVYGNKSVFSKLISEIIFLEKEGVEIEIDGKKINIRFVLLLILGDNLGVNSILGFQESFQSNYFCRICRMHKNETKHSIREELFLLRNEQNYETDSADLTFGIKEECVFHILPSFHVTKNVSCDMMHDLFEGVCRYDMAHIVNYLTEKFFSLEQLNERIKLFKVSDADVGNPIPEIKRDHLKKHYIVMSSSEMMAFVSYLGIIIGDLVPENDTFWNFYILLHQIVGILLSRVLSKSSVDYLQILIEEHNTLYCELFEDSLKPKHHLLTHYPRLISEVGPLRNIWSMRFEAFHRILKSTANAVTSRRNLLYTLAVKHQLKFANRSVRTSGLITKIEFGPSDDRTITQKEYDNIRRHCNLSCSVNDVCSVPWVKIDNILYKLSYILEISEEESNKFGMISYIMLISSNVIFGVRPVTTHEFRTHVQAYEVKDMCDDTIFWLQKSALLNRLPYYVHYMANGSKFISIIQ